MTDDRCEPQDLPWRASQSGPVITIRLTPKSTQDSIEGVMRLSDGRNVFAARVRAVPDKGKANAALTKLVAAWLDVPAGCVRIAAGRTSRLKSVLVEGDAESLVHLLPRVRIHQLTRNGARYDKKYKEKLEERGCSPGREV